MSEQRRSLLDGSSAEKDVIRYLLYSPPSVRDAAGIITPDNFANPRLGNVFNLVAGMVSAAENPRSIDTMAVVEEIRRRRAADPRGWPDHRQIIELSVDAPSTATVPAANVLDASLRRQNSDVGRRIIQEAETHPEPATIAPRAASAFTAIRDSGPRTGRITTRALGDIADDFSLRSYRWVVKDLLEAGDRLIVTGEEGLGKSVFLRQLVILPGAGLHPFHLTPIAPVKSVIVDCENSERQWHRKAGALMRVAARMGCSDVRDNVQVACVGRIDITSSGDLAEVHRLMDEHDPQVLVIGPLYKLIPKAVTNDDDAAPLITALDSLRERDVALLMEAHAAHAGMNGQDWRPRGSRALMGWPEFGLGLGRNRDNPGHYADVHRWRGDRDERDWPSVLVRGRVAPAWLSDDALDNARRQEFHEEERYANLPEAVA